MVPDGFAGGFSDVGNVGAKVLGKTCAPPHKLT